MRAIDLASRLQRAGRVGISLGAVAVLGGMGLAAAAEAPAEDPIGRGSELFHREWVKGDGRSHGGDGLGPVFNDSSCVACHNAGASGGAGPASKNVDIISAVSTRPSGVTTVRMEQPSGFLQGALETLVGIERPKTPAPGVPRKPTPPDTTELVKAHAGFRTARSVVLHRFSTDPGYESWRWSMKGMGQFGMRAPFSGLSNAHRAQAELQQVKNLMQFEGSMGVNRRQGRAGEFALLHSQRNPTALFGAGLIDAVPDDVLEAAAKVKHPGSPEVAGRVSRQKDKRIGRFGWKGQTPSLNDFVLTACAVELGLEVPGHHQGGLPQSPETKATGLDLSADECAALEAYVRNLPKPAERAPSGDSEAHEIAAGKTLFAGSGCAACHTPKLGNAEGIYSDLLLHDMGPDLGDTGQYGVVDPDSSEPDFVDPEQPLAAETTTTPAVVVAEAPGVAAVVAAPRVLAEPALTVTTTETVVIAGSMTPGNGMARNASGIARRPASGPATRQEWRTPPLWGFRDSGPYLHDGRAATLDQAVALHGGEGTSSARHYFMLSPEERLQLQAFLKTLVAPVDRLASASE